MVSKPGTDFWFQDSGEELMSDAKDEVEVEDAVEVEDEIEVEEEVEERMGRLSVLLVGAKGLRKADFMGKSDPYVELTFLSQQLQTSTTKRQTLNPLWNETFDFKGTRASFVRNGLGLKVFDYDWRVPKSSHESIGEASVPLRRLEHEGHWYEEVPIPPGKGTPPNTGTVSITFTWLPAVEVILKLARTESGLGLHFDTNNEVTHLLTGCAAEAHGGVRVGDILLAVDNVKVRKGDHIGALFPMAVNEFELRLSRIPTPKDAERERHRREQSGKYEEADCL